MQTTHHRLWLLLALVLAAGCGTDSGPKCYPVFGTVTLDGKPLADAMLVLHPLENDQPQVQRPLAYSDSAGEFEFTTRQSGDGAPAGSYAITVELREQTLDGDELVRDGQHLLPGRYRDPALSGFRCTVIPGDNEIPTIDIKSE